MYLEAGDITVEFAIKNRPIHQLKLNFLIFSKNLYFHRFPMPGSPGTPPGRSRDTRDRFYIDGKIHFLDIFIFIIICLIVPS